MKRELLDTLPVGILGGLVSALLGYVILGTAWGWVQDESLAYFHREVFWGSPLYKDRIASLCVLAIVPAFHLGPTSANWTNSPGGPCWSWC